MNSLAQSSLVNARGGWASLLKHQKVFNSCDDGVLGEGYSEAVVNCSLEIGENLMSLPHLQEEILSSSVGYFAMLMRLPTMRT
jgi:hypothetical protein